MGTTADKLNKLKATKEAIRTAINNKGGTLTENDTFASYSNAIDNIQLNGGSLKTLLDATKSSYNLFYQYGGENVDDLINYNDTSNVVVTRYMFYYCYNLTTIPNLDTSKVFDMSDMFCNCSKLITIPQLNTSSCTDMYQMFFKCSNLTTMPQLNTSNVTNMANMFHSCSSLTTIPQLDMSKVTNIGGMFENCYNLITVPQLNTSLCTEVSTLFYNCYKLTMIDMTHMNITYAPSSRFFAYNCYSLTKLIIRNMDKIPALESNSFNNCYHFYGTQNDTYNPNSLKDGRIYVPDDKVDELKAATNWSVFADIIVPLSTLVEE